jgi:HTH-type transcriptional regulator, sugar sensing transcriptional regulator
MEYVTLTLSLEKQELMKMYDKQNETYTLNKRDQTYNKQLVTIEETLARFGLLKNEIKVYLYLARSGEKKAGEIAENISLHRTETYRLLRDLEKKGIVFSIFEKPLKFTAVPLGKAIDLLIDAQKIQIKRLEQEKATILELWQSIPQLKVLGAKKELFQMLEGEQQVLMKANELLDGCERQFQVFASGDYTSLLYYSEFSDKLKKQVGKISVTLVTDDSPKSAYFTKQLDWLSEKYEISDDGSLPCFMISDCKEVLIAFQEKGQIGEDSLKKKIRTTAIWTNYGAFVKVLDVLFSKLTL